MFLIPISLQPNDVDLRSFILRSMSDWIISCLKYQRFTLSGCQNIGMRKFEFWQKLNFFEVYLPQLLPNLFSGLRSHETRTSLVKLRFGSVPKWLGLVPKWLGLVPKWLGLVGERKSRSGSAVWGKSWSFQTSHWYSEEGFNLEMFYMLEEKNQIDIMYRK